MDSYKFFKLPWEEFTKEMDKMSVQDMQAKLSFAHGYILQASKYTEGLK